MTESIRPFHWTAWAPIMLPMKHVRVMLVFFALGAIITCSVALGFYLRHEPTWRNITQNRTRVSVKIGPSEQHIWDHWTDDDWPVTPAHGSGLFRFGFSYVSLAAWEGVDQSVEADLSAAEKRGRLFGVDRIQCGWPFKALYFDHCMIYRNSIPVRFKTTSMMIRYHELPYLPLVFGFLINSFLYGVIIWFFFGGMNELTRLLRRHRGLCEGCAYDLRGTEHEACPECGAEIAKA